MVDLIVKAGTTLIIAQPITGFYDLFTMEDNSTIKVQANILIQAISASFGDGCIIDGSGSDGANAPSQTYIPPQAQHCNSGATGVTGNPGGTGTNGHDINIQTGLTHLGGLIIRSNGGRGGVGSSGGTGADGGQAQCVPPCRGAGGGPGGHGGTGGSGGDSGQVTFIWSPLQAYRTEHEKRTGKKFDDLLQLAEQIHGSIRVPSGSRLMPVLPTGLVIQASGGPRGNAGAGGVGGRGGDGTGCVWGGMNGGDPGGRGGTGLEGFQGKTKPYIAHLGT
jgi:hypothetical protein